MRSTRPAFTLIELLVVITIIVVLLSLLAPALDRAIQQAELVVCASNLNGIAGSANLYTMENNRFYPYRPTIDYGRFAFPNNLFYRGSIDPSRPNTNNAAANAQPKEDADDRPYLVGFNFDQLIDPLSGGIDVRIEETSPETWGVYGNYALWFGMKFPNHATMKRMGDRLTTYTDRAERAFQLLASDMDVIQPGLNNSAYGSHPDSTPGTMSFLLLFNDGGTPPAPNKLTVSEWQKKDSTDGERGLVTTNYAYTDGSVRRFENVAWDAYKDGRMARVPQAAYRADVLRWHNVPPH